MLWGLRGSFFIFWRSFVLNVKLEWGFDAAFGLNTFAVFPLWHETKKKVGWRGCEG